MLLFMPVKRVLLLDISAKVSYYLQEEQNKLLKMHHGAGVLRDTLPQKNRETALLFEQFAMYCAVLVENYKNIKSGTSN